MSFNSPFWNFFDSINDEVNQFNKLLASNGYEDRVRVSPNSNQAQSNNNQQVAKKESARDSDLIFPSLFNTPFFNRDNFNIVPPLDIIDNEKEYELHVSIPGVEKDQISVDFHPETNKVLIKGEIPDHTKESEKGSVKVQERSYGKFERSVALPSSAKINEENIKASFKNGVLVLKIPKVEEEKKAKRAITIE